MSVRSTLLATVGCATLFAILAAPTTATAQQVRLANFASFGRVDADPTKDYSLTESHGPWLILAASFAGPGAAEESRQLVLELRKRFKLNAYTHSQHFDFSEEVGGRGFDRYGHPKRMKHNTDREYDEIAVMVGNFPSINNPELQKTLKQIKYLQPTCLTAEGKPTTQRFANLRTVQRYINGRVKKQQSKGPLGSAFVARNPMLPQEYFTPTGYDAFVENMNKGFQHSLLKCPKSYSIRVATFRGNMIIDQKEVARVEKTGGMESQLTKAAEDAHQLTAMLRKRGVEAYEFHNRRESIVTVGSFDEVGRSQPGGQMRIDPRVLKVIESYAPAPKKLPNGTESEPVPKSLGGISFDAKPMPIEIPKRSIAADYSRNR